MKIVRKSRKARAVRTSGEETSFQSKRKMTKRMKRNRMKRRLIVFFFLLVCAGVVFVVFKAPFFDIKTIYCEGQKTLTQEQILKISEVKKDVNIFSTSIKGAINRLESHPEIEDANIRRIFPNKIKIWVREAKVSALAEKDNKIFMLDRNGMIIRTALEETADALPQAPKIEGVEINVGKPGEYAVKIDDPKTEELFRFINSLSDLGMLEKVKKVDFSDLSDIEMNYDDRLDILFGSTERLDYKLKFVRKVIDENISDFEHALFDYRGDKLYVGPPVEEKTEPEEIPEESAKGENAEETEEPTVVEEEKTQTKTQE